MSDSVEAPDMTKALRQAEVEALLREIQRYLSYVEAFRAEPPPPPAKREGKEKS